MLLKLNMSDGSTSLTSCWIDGLVDHAVCSQIFESDQHDIDGMKNVDQISNAIDLVLARSGLPSVSPGYSDFLKQRRGFWSTNLSVLAWSRCSSVNDLESCESCLRVLSQDDHVSLSQNPVVPVKSAPFG